MTKKIFPSLGQSKTCLYGHREDKVFPVCRLLHAKASFASWGLGTFISLARGSITRSSKFGARFRARFSTIIFARICKPGWPLAIENVRPGTDSERKLSTYPAIGTTIPVCLFKVIFNRITAASATADSGPYARTPSESTRCSRPSSVIETGTRTNSFSPISRSVI